MHESIGKEGRVQNSCQSTVHTDNLFLNREVANSLDLEAREEHQIWQHWTVGALGMYRPVSWMLSGLVLGSGVSINQNAKGGSSLCRHVMLPINAANKRNWAPSRLKGTGIMNMVSLSKFKVVSVALQAAKTFWFCCSSQYTSRPEPWIGKQKGLQTLL